MNHTNYTIYIIVWGEPICREEGILPKNNNKKVNKKVQRGAQIWRIFPRTLHDFGQSILTLEISPRRSFTQKKKETKKKKEYNKTKKKSY